MSPLTHRVSRSTWYMLFAIYLSMLAIVVAGMMYTRYTAELSAQKWCGVLRIYHDAYSRNPPPTTQVGKDIQRQLENLYVDFKCSKVKPPKG